MDKITLAHGGGGKRTRELISNLFLKYLNPYLKILTDGVNLGDLKRTVVTTDGFVVDPLFFPGGNIGKLAICGICNDLAVMGAKPKFITMNFIIEEGFLTLDLEKIIKSIASEAKSAGIDIVAGDTKVVPKGHGGGIYISGTGVGEMVYKNDLPGKIKEGDLVFVNGSIGDHSAALLVARNDFKLSSKLKSDCQNIYPEIKNLLDKSKEVKFLRDITRGGLAAILNELAEYASCGIEIAENSIPFKKEVLSLCAMLGYDFLTLACEGRFLAVIDANDEKIALSMGLTKIGAITDNHKKVVLKTKIGGERVIDLPDGELLPRIC